MEERGVQGEGRCKMGIGQDRTFLDDAMVNR